jgi:hypothetical protein
MSNEKYDTRYGMNVTPMGMTQMKIIEKYQKKNQRHKYRVTISRVGSHFTTGLRSRIFGRKSNRLKMSTI